MSESALPPPPEDALNVLMLQLERDLREAAHWQIRRLKPGETLQTTALLNEAYLKLQASARREWQDEGHFIAFAARTMRHIILDYHAAKRGEITLPSAQLLDDDIPDPLELRTVLETLENEHERWARAVDLHIFCGYSLEETARLLRVSLATAKTDWRNAKDFLYARLR